MAILISICVLLVIVYTIEYFRPAIERIKTNKGYMIILMYNKYNYDFSFRRNWVKLYEYETRN